MLTAELLDAASGAEDGDDPSVILPEYSKWERGTVDGRIDFDVLNPLNQNIVDTGDFLT